MLTKTEAKTLIETLLAVPCVPTPHGAYVSLINVLAALESACDGGFAIVAKGGRLSVQLPDPDPVPAPPAPAAPETP